MVTHECIEGGWPTVHSVGEPSAANASLRRRHRQSPFCAGSVSAEPTASVPALGQAQRRALGGWELPHRTANRIPEVPCFGRGHGFHLPAATRFGAERSGWRTERRHPLEDPRIFDRAAEASRPEQEDGLLRVTRATSTVSGQSGSHVDAGEARITTHSATTKTTGRGASRRSPGNDTPSGGSTGRVSAAPSTSVTGDTGRWLVARLLERNVPVRRYSGHLSAAGQHLRHSFTRHSGAGSIASAVECVRVTTASAS